jgi:hypothetical protein
MSTFVNLDSVCGKQSAAVDVYDLDANPDGVVCCDNCKSILICRNAWNYLYKKTWNDLSKKNKNK